MLICGVIRGLGWKYGEADNNLYRGFDLEILLCGGELFTFLG